MADGWMEYFSCREKLCYRKVTELVMSNIAAHESEFDPNSNSSDFVDAYLAEIARTTDAASSFHAANGGRESLVNTVVDLVRHLET